MNFYLDANVLVALFSLGAFIVRALDDWRDDVSAAQMAFARRALAITR